MEKAGKYVDGFIVPVPKDKIDDYRKISETAGRVWKEYGALEYIECVADDVKPGKLTSFPQAVMLEDNEVVVFSWILYESREKRDEVMAKVMKDPRLAEMMNPQAMPFDGKRMIFGGFNTLLVM